VRPTHFYALHAAERPLFGLTWPELLVLAAAAPILLWSFLTPLPLVGRLAVLVPVGGLAALLRRSAADPTLHLDRLPRAVARYLLRPRRATLLLDGGLLRFRA
jgi:hypothetical protein